MTSANSLMNIRVLVLGRATQHHILSAPREKLQFYSDVMAIMNSTVDRDDLVRSCSRGYLNNT